VGSNPTSPTKKEVMYKAKLQRMTAGINSGLRTNMIEGECHDLPKTGRPFILMGPPLETKIGMRYVETSPVAELLIDSDADYSFRTASGSVYRLWVEKIQEQDKCQYAHF
jgi:hypothetical protein